MLGAVIILAVLLCSIWSKYDKISKRIVKLECTQADTAASSNIIAESPITSHTTPIHLPVSGSSSDDSGIVDHGYSSIPVFIPESGANNHTVPKVPPLTRRNNTYQECTERNDGSYDVCGDGYTEAVNTGLASYIEIIGGESKRNSIEINGGNSEHKSDTGGYERLPMGTVSGNSHKYKDLRQMFENGKTQTDSTGYDSIANELEKRNRQTDSTGYEPVTNGRNSAIHSYKKLHNDQGYESLKENNNLSPQYASLKLETDTLPGGHRKETCSDYIDASVRCGEINEEDINVSL